MKAPFSHALATVAIAIIPLTGYAQTEPDAALQQRISQLRIVSTLSDAHENPRGVYKLTGLLDSYGNLIKEPFDQYKICTDSVTMMLTISGNQFLLGRNDKSIFNYTGEEPDAHDATATRIFNSNAEHFTLKWWSTTSGHLYFPHNDWCTEYYESGKYSETGKKIIDALMSTSAKDPKNPLIGSWRMIGMVDELRDMKQELKRLQDNPSEGFYFIFTPTNIVAIGRNTGMLYPAPNPYDKKTFKVGNNENKITWLSKDLIAIEVRQGYHTDYKILQRMSHSTVYDGIASHYVTR